MSCSPSGFDLPDIGHVTFVHVKEASYRLSLVRHPRGFVDSARVQSSLTFTVLEEGRPAFDFTAPGLGCAVDATFDGSEASFRQARFPGLKQWFRYLDTNLSPGSEHTLTCEHDLNTGHLHSDVLDEMDGGIRFRLRMMDVAGSTRFSGAYWPSNFEFDRFPVTLDIEIQGSDKPHRVMHNGLGDLPPAGQQFSIAFPAVFSPSFAYLDVFPEGSFSVETRKYSRGKGKDKDKVKLVAYTRSGFARSDVLDDFLKQAKRHLRSLEEDFGPFPHDRLIMNARIGRGGGMEYAGATDTDIEFLYHELNHSYFARCIAPADGNSGWMDEAIAVWCDESALFEKRRKEPPAVGSDMGARSRFVRGTSSAASGPAGAQLMAYLHHLLKDQGGLTPLLRKYYEQQRWKCTTGEDFESLLCEVLPPEVVRDLFDRSVRGL